MIEAEKLFYSSPSHHIDYYVSAERMDHVPALIQPEVRGLLKTRSSHKCYIPVSGVSAQLVTAEVFLLSSAE